MNARLLIVEDERRTAMLMQAILEAEGYIVTANVASANAALEALDEAPVDAALLDINVEDGQVYPVARRLESENVPFGFCTSVPSDEIAEDYGEVPRAHKPFDAYELVQFVRTIVKDRRQN